MTTTTSRVRRPGRNAWMAARLFAVTLAMFGFGYALVPLYDIVCDLTGLGGRTGVVSEADARADMSAADPTREVTVQFIASVNQGLRIDFAPPAEPLRVHPGRVYDISFSATNLLDRPQVVQAVPSVTPIAAAANFNKIECFCFTRQELAPRETRRMPVRFVVDADLPERIGTLTLAYTFFAAKPAPDSATPDAPQPSLSKAAAAPASRAPIPPGTEDNG